MFQILDVLTVKKSVSLLVINVEKTLLLIFELFPVAVKSENFF